MKKIQALFIALVLGLMAIPWFSLPQPQLTGVEKDTALPSFSWQAYGNGTFQKQLEGWWNGHFGSRSTMLVMKNNIYDNLNFGQFHSGYWGNILQGRHGTLYELGYLSSKFSPYHPDDIRKNAEETVMLLARLRDRLAGMGKHFLFIMAPSKADARYESLPRIWQFRARHTPEPPSVYPIWEKELTKKNIIYVNALELLKKKNILKDSFPDTGTHWSMLAAGLTWEEGVKRLKNAGADLPTVLIKGERISDKACAAERDIADLLNIYPPYHKGRTTWKMATYHPISAKNSVNVISIGDSFSNQIYMNILQSGFSNNNTISQFENHLPTREEWFHMLNESNILILTYTYPKLHSSRIKDEVVTLLNYTNDIILENWNNYEESGKGQWSKYNSNIAFFHSAERDCTFSFLLKSIFHSKILHISINKHTLYSLPLDTITSHRKITITIPKTMLTKGINRINFLVEGASIPMVVTEENIDSRLIGVFCSDFSIQ